MNKQSEYPRRFVAGAACTKCRQVDSTVIFTVNMQYHIECIKCGLTQSQEDFQSKAAGAQPLHSTPSIEQTLQFKPKNSN